MRVTVIFLHMGERQQVLYIHGGMTFPTHAAYLHFLRTKELTLDRLRVGHDWKDNLQSVLGEGYDVLAPRMPNGMNAQYPEWTLWFSRIVSLLNAGVILIGHSLGGVFLVRYLSEQVVPMRVKATMLVAAPYRDDVPEESLGDFLPPDDLSLFKDQGGSIFIYHSTDDPVVPFEHGISYARALPEATMRECQGRGHFNVESFPELEADIRML